MRNTHSFLLFHYQLNRSYVVLSLISFITRIESHLRRFQVHDFVHNIYNCLYRYMYVSWTIQIYIRIEIIIGQRHYDNTIIYFFRIT